MTTLGWLVASVDWLVASVDLVLRLRIEIAIPLRVTAIPKKPVADIFSPKIIHPKRAANGGASVIRSCENRAVIMV